MAEARDRFRERQLIRAVTRNNARQVQEFLDNGFDPDIRLGEAASEPLISRAVSAGAFDVVDCLAQNGADLDVRIEPFGMTPLQKAIIEKKLSVVRTLVQAGADVNLRDAAGNENALLMASRELGGFPDVIRQIASRMTPDEIDACDNAGWMALDHLTNNGLSHAEETDLKEAIARFREVNGPSATSTMHATPPQIGPCF